MQFFSTFMQPFFCQSISQAHLISTHSLNQNATRQIYITQYIQSFSLSSVTKLPSKQRHIIF
jgi:hypothetical protein